MHSLLLWLVLSVSAAAPPPPTISSVDPIGVWIGTPQFTLTVNGAGFRAGATVNWDGAPLQTTFVSEARLTAVVPASLLTTAATHQITVVMTGGQGGTSNAFPYDVYNPPPTVSSISPASAPVFSALITVTVNGSNFVPTSVVRFDNSSRPTTFVSSTRLTAQLGIANLSVPGVARISVTTPAPGGGNSASFQFLVVHPAPTITQLTPSQRPVRAAGFTLAVDGTQFFASPNSVVLWNGAERPTTFVSSTRLTASIPASDLTTSGTASVSVRTRAGDSNRTSAPVAFGIAPPATVIEPVPLVPVAPPPDLPEEVAPASGGSGGNAFTRRCGAGRVMTGLSYRAGLVVDALVLLCRTVGATGTLGVESAVGTAVGGSGPFTVAHCNAGDVVGFMSIYHGLYVDGIVLHCYRWIPAERRFDQARRALYNREIGRAFPTVTNAVSGSSCTRDVQPGSGIHGRASGVVDAVGLLCNEP